MNAIRDPIRDPINDPINVSLSDFDLLVIRTIKDHPGLNTRQILNKINTIDPAATIDRIKNSLKRNLSDLCEFRGSRNSGGYYILERNTWILYC